MSQSALLALPDAPTTTIAAIRSTIFRLPMRGALHWGKSGLLTEARHLLIEVELSNGAVGMAEAPPRPTIYGETAASITAILRDELAPRLHGQPPAAAHARMHEIANNHVAKGALDIALHDAVARSRGITLAELLGATRTHVQAAYILGMADEEATLAEAQRIYNLGVRVFKVKVGRVWQDDIARIARLQAALPDDAALYADANECLAAEDAIEDAAAKLAELRAMGLLYCEEPLPVEHIQARSHLRQAAALPIIGDDSCFTPRDLRRELAFETFDILNIKTPRTGYTDSLTMLGGAVRAGKGVMVGSQAGAGLAAAQAAIFAARAEVEHPAEISFFLKLEEDIAGPAMPIVNGFVALADAAAVTVDRNRLRDAQVCSS